MRGARPLLAGLLVTATYLAPALTPAGAATRICVAVVVDASSLGGPVTHACATVPSGSTGVDVLQAAGHRVTFDPRYGEDFVCAIDGRPASGCSGTDDSHFWAYYHRAPRGSTWTISQEGAGTYRPANASTEGWVYDDGDATAPTPPDIPYSEICPRTSASPATTAPATSQPRATTPAAGVATALSTTAGATTPPRRHRHRRPAAAASPAPTTDGPTGAPAPARRLAADPAPARRGAPVGLVLGTVAAAALAGGATWQVRRRR